ncbi:hypothetical protein EHYA_04532 [Embleya hyalina]|uniref:Uncharacterized protein n=1 Tax=Embleya hyalina TaxID=516124 RepID=A0A401YQM3_9ACTN|nr:hypothetical protein EHYA_04532 [Embleya hyalina]
MGACRNPPTARDPVGESSADEATAGLRHVGRQDEERVAVSVGPDGNVVALWARRGGLPVLVSATTRSGGATLPDPRVPRPVTVRVSTHTPEPTGSVELAGLEPAHVTVQPLPENRILVGTPELGGIRTGSTAPSGAEQFAPRFSP